MGTTYTRQPLVVWEKLMGTWSTTSAMPPSSFVLSTAEVEPLRKLRSRFSCIYVHTLVTEIDRRTTRKSKFGYDIDTVPEAIFLRYSSLRVDLYTRTRTKDLRISSTMRYRRTI